MSLVEPDDFARESGAKGTVRRYAGDSFEASADSLDQTQPCASDEIHRKSSDQVRAAVDDLRLARPELSASGPVWVWQTWAAVLGAAGMILGSAVAPQAIWFTGIACLSVSFLGLSMLRVFSVWHGVHQSIAIKVEPFAAEALPIYTVLVPLFREAAIANDLVSALAALDYPASRLQVLLILEEADLATRDAIARLALPVNFEVTVVPAGEPQTKPRALNFALPQTRGEFVVVYDAEDMPENDQLLRAVAAFGKGPPNLSCLQARLNVYNAEQSWLTRQFTIEYTALFDWLLPALQALKLPVPLGGTSNHFRTVDLRAAGAWDPFNVTEDADLGIRLARDGRIVEVLNSTTWEEAPHLLSSWMWQRQRWLKGWLQTYLVHTRQPRRLWRELGAWRFCGLQLLMGGLIVSALIHPVFYVAAAVCAWQGTLLVAPSGVEANLLWGVGLFNLITGYVTAVFLGAVAVTRRGWLWLTPHALLMPVYWLMVSAAAYAAVFQFLAAPHFWNKTDHAARSGTTALLNEWHSR